MNRWLNHVSYLLDRKPPLPLCRTAITSARSPPRFPGGWCRPDSARWAHTLSRDLLGIAVGKSGGPRIDAALGAAADHANVTHRRMRQLAHGGLVGNMIGGDQHREAGVGDWATASDSGSVGATYRFTSTTTTSKPAAFAHHFRTARPICPPPRMIELGRGKVRLHEGTAATSPPHIVPTDLRAFFRQTVVPQTRLTIGIKPLAHHSRMAASSFPPPTVPTVAAVRQQHHLRAHFGRAMRPALPQPLPALPACPAPASHQPTTGSDAVFRSFYVPGGYRSGPS